MGVEPFDLPLGGNDGAPWLSLSATNVAFCNGQYFGGGMKVGPHADATDQQLGVTVWRSTFCGFVMRLFSVYNGKHVSWASTSTMTGPAFEVKAPTASASTASSSPLTFEIDGEKGFPLPAVVSIAAKVAFCTPSPGTPKASSPLLQKKR